MKRIKISFMIFIIMAILFYSINFDYINIGKETEAYSTRETVFSSGMDLYFWNKVDRLYNHILFDLSPYENYGESVTGSNPILTWGRYGKALQFDGSNDYILISDSDSLDIEANK